MEHIYGHHVQFEADSIEQWGRGHTVGFLSCEERRPCQPSRPPRCLRRKIPIRCRSRLTSPTQLSRRPRWERKQLSIPHPITSALLQQAPKSKRTVRERYAGSVCFDVKGGAVVAATWPLPKEACIDAPHENSHDCIERVAPTATTFAKVILDRVRPESPGHHPGLAAEAEPLERYLVCRCLVNFRTRVATR